MEQLPTLSPLPYPVYFVTKNVEVWEDVMTGKTKPILENLYHRFVDANDSWSTQPYIQLKQRGLNVQLVSRVIPGKICIVTYEDLAIKDLPFRSYVVGCRHDRGRPEICEQRIVQNPLNVIDETDHFLPHWPQPGLKPRQHDRKSKVENLVYKGRGNNLASPFKTSDFLSQLEKLGIQLLMSPEDNNRERVIDATNYETADVVLAVRNCTEYNLSIKPPSKLINAWLAGVPALLGPEPAYQQLRKSELDYIEVRSPQEVIQAIKRLKNDPDLYLAMIENGRQRAKEFTPDQIALHWRNLLAGEIATGYEKWLNHSSIYKTFGRPLQFAYRAFKHKQERKYFLENIHKGTRLFPE